MGANNVLPAVPTFGPGAPSISQLNALSYAVSFLSNQSVRPTWHLYSKVSQTINSGAWNECNFASKAYDSDGVFNSPFVQIVTQGFYATECCVQVQATTTAISTILAFKIVGGGVNPHLSIGAAEYYGFRADSTSLSSVAVADNSFTACDVTPFCLYPGDIIAPEFIDSGTLTMDHLTNTSFNQGRWSMNFTGYLCNTGT